eukprot:6066219-Pyramimonas_sp.AAC.1
MNNALVHVSRLGRLYLVNISVSVAAPSISCSVIGQATFTGNVSDHIPVVATCRTSVPPDVLKIPSWVGPRPIFYAELEFLLKDMDRSAPIGRQVCLVKQCTWEAANQTRRRMK